MDIDILIGEIQKRPVIWDTSIEEYKDRNKKNAAWMEVCEVLFEGFCSQMQVEQKAKVTEVIAKWKTIRDNYVRSLNRLAKSQKSGSGKTKNPRYIYEEQLRFLQKSREMRPTDDSFQSSLNDGDIDNDGNDLRENEDLTETPQIVETISEKRKKEHDIESKIVTFIENSSKKRKYEDDDEDMAFFVSLLSSIKKFEADDKLQFRIEVMQLIQKFKAGNRHAVTGQMSQNSAYSYDQLSRPSSSSMGSYLTNFSPTNEYEHL